MVFARSSRPTVAMVATALAAALSLAGAAAWRLVVGDGWTSLVLTVAVLVVVAVAARGARRLRGGPASRLGVFQDRLVLVNGRTELQAPWREIRTATLSDQTDQGLPRWPDLRMTDRLTVSLKTGRAFSFRPRTYGLDPVACLDLFLRLRDELDLASRLPQFDSELDLRTRPAHTGDVIRPQL